jgi:predicted RNA-binding Zn ribbon-like protein
VSTDLLVDFLNTFDEEELGDDRAASSWFRARDLPAKGLRAADARAVRDALRAAVDGRTPPQSALALVPLRAAAGDEGLTLVSEHPLGTFVAAAVRLAYEGRWDRLKLCDMDTCRYAFYDASRNRSGKWCDMAVCGNRAKTRAFRERHRP